MEYFSVFDFILALLFSLFFIARAKKKRDRLIETNPAYEFYSKGLTAKFSAVFSFCLIYLFYYKGGDTLAYYKGVKSLYNLFWTDPSDYFYVMTHGGDWDTWTKFTSETGWPPKYIHKDSRTRLVMKMTNIVAFPAFGGYITTSILLAKITYKWVWNAFELVADKYPEIKKQIAISFLYLPSVIFWGSGIMKDTYTFAASCFCLYGIHTIFIKKESILKNSIQLLIAIYLILSIKAYILFALLPGTMIYLNFERIKKIKSKFLKLLFFPASFGLIILISQTFFINFEEEFGKYSADRILEEAALQQQDLTREVYGTNSFDIGQFAPTIQGVASKIPVAINAAIFRPYLWEVGSPTMLISAIENMILMIIIVYFFIKVGPIQFFRLIAKDSYLLFSLIFTLTLAFGIGLSTANFGALVRYKIPFMPFFVSLFYIMNWYINSKENKT
jgi:hypothetical protein